MCTLIQHEMVYRVYTLCMCYAAILQELISSGQLAGSLRGRLDKAVYIPHVYTQMQNAWTDSFLASSGYLGLYKVCNCCIIIFHGLRRSSATYFSPTFCMGDHERL